MTSSISSSDTPSPLALRRWLVVSAVVAGGGIAFLSVVFLLIDPYDSVPFRAMIRAAMGNTDQSTTVGWVPLFHDMGLVMNVMQPLFNGAHSILMPPAAFMQRPLSWLRAISTYRAEVTCAPNFAFELCAARYRPEQMDGIDLSCLRVALNGAEPVHPPTIARFAAAFAAYGFDPAAMHPGYGLAEATLLVTGAGRGDGPARRTWSRHPLSSR